MSTFPLSYSNNSLFDTKSYNQHYFTHSASGDDVARPICGSALNQGRGSSYLPSHDNYSQPTYNQSASFIFSKKASTQCTESTPYRPYRTTAPSLGFSSALENGESVAPSHTKSPRPHDLRPGLASPLTAVPPRASSHANSPVNAFVPHIIQSSFLIRKNTNQGTSQGQCQRSPGSFSFSMSEGHGRGHPSSVSPIRILSQSSQQLGDDDRRNYDTFDAFALHPSPLKMSRNQVPIFNSDGRRSQGGNSPPKRSPPPPPSFSIGEFTPKRRSHWPSHEVESIPFLLQPSSGIDSLGHARNLENVVTYLKNYYAQETGEDKCGLETLQSEDIVTLAKCFCKDVQRLVRERRQEMGMNVDSFAVGESPLSGVISNTTYSESSASNSGENITKKGSLQEGGGKKTTHNAQSHHHRGTTPSDGSISVVDKNTETDMLHEPSQDQKRRSSFQSPPLQEEQSKDLSSSRTQIIEAIVPAYGTPLKRAGSQASASFQLPPQRRVSIVTSPTDVYLSASHPHEDISLTSLSTWQTMSIIPLDARTRAPAVPFVNPRAYVASRPDSAAGLARASSSAPLGLPPSRPGSTSVGPPLPQSTREEESNGGRVAKSTKSEARDGAGADTHLTREQGTFHGEGPRGSLSSLMKFLRQGTYLVKYFSSFRTPHIRFFCVQDCMTKFNGREVRMPHLVWRPKEKDHRFVEHFKEDGSKSNALNLIHLHTARLGLDLAPELFKRRGTYVIDHCGRPLPADMCVVLIFHSRTLGLSFLTKADRQLWMEAFTAIIDRNRSLYH